MKKIALLIALLVVFGGTPLVFAETTTSANVEAQVTSINSLTEQIKALQAERKTLVSSLVTELRQGSKGDAVTTLQTLLALDPSVYPEGFVTGFFGKLTSEAVKKFQKKNGLQQVGNVGPKTKELLKKLADDSDLTAEDSGGSNSGKGKRLCAIVPPGHLIAKGWLKRHDGKAPTIPNCQTLPKGIQDKLNGDHDDDDDGDEDSDENDTTAPTISELSVTNITTTGAKIAWKTNEDAKDKIWYGTTNPVVTSGEPSKKYNYFDDSHKFNLSGLTANTTYYFVVSSTDSSGNTTVSSQGSFKTLEGDTTGPVITELGATDVDDTEAEITWKTNEDAKDKIWYSTANPVVTSGTPQMTDSDYDDSHKFEIIGLTVNTTYYYIVSSTDTSGNTTMSEQKSFTTDAD